MKEKITDEMIEHFAKGYEMYKEMVEKTNLTLVFTFEQYVERALQLREIEIRKAVDFINGKEEKKEKQT